jgi:hypothetical protein
MPSPPKIPPVVMSLSLHIASQGSLATLALKIGHSTEKSFSQKGLRGEKDEIWFLQMADWRIIFCSGGTAQ